MNEEQIKDTLQRLARSVVINEIVIEHFLTQERRATVDEIGATIREITEQVEADVKQRFPGLSGPVGESDPRDCDAGSNQFSRVLHTH